MTSLGIVGCGTLGRAILEAATRGEIPYTVAGVASRTAATAQAYLATLPDPPPYLPLAALVERADLLVEAAGQPVVPELARAAFAAGKDLLVISGGALLEHPELLDEARARGCRLIVPSGAIAAIDGVKAACQGPMDHVTITTRKPPEALEGSPYLLERGISLAGLTEEREVYAGPVREGCRGFPANVNVAACVSLAGLGPDRTRMRILAVPGLGRNCHTVEVVGYFGRITMSIENVPTENPRTGRLTVLAILRALRDAADPVRIGN